MKIGIDSFCYHRYFGEVYAGQEKPAQNMTLSDFLQRAAQLGVGGVTIESAFLPAVDASYANDLKSELDGYGLERIFSWGHPNGLERGIREEDMFNQMTALIPFAAGIGADIMRIVVSANTWQREDAKERIAWLTPRLKEAAKTAADAGIRLAVESNMGFTAEELLRLLEAVDSEQLGVEFDSGNFARMLIDPARALDILARYTLAVHLKDVRPNPQEARLTDWYFFSCVPVGQGLTDDQSLINTLAASGYQGFVGLQIDYPHSDWYGREDEMVWLSVRKMKELVAAVQES